MGRLVKWDNEIGNSGKKDDSRVPFLKLVSGVKCVMRPVGFPVEFYKFFNRTADGMRFAITDDPDILQNYDLEPSHRYAINVIDRSDGVLKVLEFPYTIYEALCKYKEMTNEDPGGKNGADFSVSKTGSGKKGTKYEVKKVQETKFTNDEVKMINGQGLYPLREIFKALPPEKIENVLFGESGGVVEESDSEETTQDVENNNGDSEANEVKLDF